MWGKTTSHLTSAKKHLPTHIFDTNVERISSSVLPVTSHKHCGQDTSAGTRVKVHHQSTCWTTLIHSAQSAVEWVDCYRLHAQHITVMDFLKSWPLYLVRLHSCGEGWEQSSLIEPFRSQWSVFFLELFVWALRQVSRAAQLLSAGRNTKTLRCLIWTVGLLLNIELMFHNESIS